MKPNNKPIIDGGVNDDHDEGDDTLGQ